MRHRAVTARVAAGTSGRRPESLLLGDKHAPCACARRARHGSMQQSCSAWARPLISPPQSTPRHLVPARPLGNLPAQRKCTTGLPVIAAHQPRRQRRRSPPPRPWPFESAPAARPWPCSHKSGSIGASANLDRAGTFAVRSTGNLHAGLCPAPVLPTRKQFSRCARTQRRPPVGFGVLPPLAPVGRRNALHSAARLVCQPLGSKQGVDVVLHQGDSTAGEPLGSSRLAVGGRRQQAEGQC